MRELLFVGTYTENILFGTGQVLPGKGKGIHFLELSPDGCLTDLGYEPDIRNPSFLCLSRDGDYLYCVNELKEFDGQASGAASSFGVSYEDGVPSLRFLSMQPTGGADPCHINVNRARTHAFVANFMSGSAAMFPIKDDGSLGPASDFVQYEGHGLEPRRQKSPHAHSVVFDPNETRAFVPDLGTDRLMAYRIHYGSGTFVPERTPFLRVAPGSGPRFMEFHPNGKWVYFINELASSVSLLDYDDESGGFAVRGTWSTLPDDFVGDNICADLHLTRDGGLLYASNRGHDSLMRFRIDPATGEPAPLGAVSCGGRTPRNFTMSLTGDYLVVANQDSDNLVSYRINHATGALDHIDEIAVPTPVCIRSFGHE